MRTALLVDGGFWLRRYHRLKGPQNPDRAAADLHWMCCEHLWPRPKKKAKKPSTKKTGTKRERRNELYRIFYYDCPPLEKKVHHPVTKAPLDFSRSPIAKWRWAFFEELKKQRKVALRMGNLSNPSGGWALRPDVLKDVLAGKKAIADLADNDVHYDIRQKGVDMKIGIDIASLAYKRQVDQIVLVAGDSDFVPAAKLARREGIDFVLDPMWATIHPDLYEHIDGLQSVWPRPSTPSQSGGDPAPTPHPPTLT